MNARSVCVAVLFSALASLLSGADETPPPLTMKERLKARIAEDAKKADGKKAPAAQGTPIATPASASAAPEPAKSEPPSAAAIAAAAAAPAAKENPTMMPKMEVTKGRITVLDQQIAQQEEAIARERKNLKASDVDVALNDSKIAKPLAMFGGESFQFRQRVTSERVQLMEAEKDILEAMKRAKTKEEKQELQKQVDELRAVRRDLEKSMR